MKKGTFITFEGGEGCGKTTQLELIRKHLQSINREYVLTREPGGCPISEEIRKLLLHGKENIDPKAEFLLFCAARAELVKKVINPALSEGKLVIADRFYDSSVAYQGIARGLGKENVRLLTEFAIGDLKPDLTVYLKISPKKAFERKGGFDVDDRIESEGIEFHNAVFEGYNKLAEEEPDRFLVIDSDDEVEKVFKNILDGISERGIIL